MSKFKLKISLLLYSEFSGLQIATRKDFLNLWTVHILTDVKSKLQYSYTNAIKN